MQQAFEDTLTRYRDNDRHKILLSVDLGKRQDFTAFVIAETKPQLRKNKRQGNITVMVSIVRDIQQLPLNTAALLAVGWIMRPAEPLRTVSR